MAKKKVSPSKNFREKYSRLRKAYACLTDWNEGNMAAVEHLTETVGNLQGQLKAAHKVIAELSEKP